MAEICFNVGARPNFMKVAPVYRTLEMLSPEGSLYLVHTGQHYYPEMSGTLRSATERPITVELTTNMVLGSAQERIVEIPAMLEQARPFRPIPLSDGRAGERSARVILRFLVRPSRAGGPA